jgi:cysteine desulfurase
MNEYQRIYFDNAATTPIDEEVVSWMIHGLQNIYGNPSSIHLEGRNARTEIEKARKKIAKILGASISEIFFTSCGTEANNLVLKNAVKAYGIESIITSKTEHPCVLESVKSLGVQTIYLSNDSDGRPNLEELKFVLKSKNQKCLVSLMHANNETGALTDIESVALACQENNALFHTDTVQTIGYYPINLQELPIHFISGSAHKFHGPKGIGFVFIRNTNPILPFIHGGSQERNMRAGTENVYGIMGMAKAMEIAYENLDSRTTHIADLKNFFIENLIKNFDGLILIGEMHGLAHYKILNVAFPTTPKTDLLLLNLDIHGISASGGSACSSGVESTSHVIKELGIKGDFKTIRFSFSHYNTIEQVLQTIEVLKNII